MTLLSTVMCFGELTVTQGLYFYLNEIHYHNSHAPFLHSRGIITEKDEDLESYIANSQCLKRSAVHSSYRDNNRHFLTWKGVDWHYLLSMPPVQALIKDPITENPLYPCPADGHMAPSQTHLIIPFLSLLYKLVESCSHSPASQHCGSYSCL